MFHLRSLRCSEILDSRGRPTLRTVCALDDEAVAAASVPSGASTGTSEALELRDGDPARYDGLGCRKAAAHVEGEIAGSLMGRAFSGPEEMDRALVELDGTPGKSRLGANALLSVSLAFARACAARKNEPLWKLLGDWYGQPPARLPRPTINLFSGGKHAGGQCPIQDVLLVPAAARTIDEALAATYAVYQAAAALIGRKYHMRALKADEGGLAPDFPNPEAMLEDAVKAIQKAGLRPGNDMRLAVDVASTHFFKDGGYCLGRENLTSGEMIARLAEWTQRYPICSIEDGLAEEDWENWPVLRETLGSRTLIVGDDLLCTNPDRIRRAVENRCADTLLLKVNQIGTLAEALEARRLARDAGWNVTISARSGETEDDWLADLAVGWGGDQIKVGSIMQSERLSKYNRLLLIERETGLPLNSWPNS